MSSSSDACTQWTGLGDHELTSRHIDTILGSVQDKLWVAAACIDRLVDQVDVERQLLQLGLRQTDDALERCKAASTEDSSSAGSTGDEQASEPKLTASLISYFEQNPEDHKLYLFRSVLLQRLDRLNTYVEMCQELPEADSEEVDSDDAEDDDIDLDEWEDNPWDQEEGSSETPSKPKKATLAPPIPLSEFLTGNLVLLACIAASKQWFHGVQTLLDRHGEHLWSYRFLILDSIPTCIQPSSYRQLLPEFDSSTNAEHARIPSPHQLTPDRVNQQAVQDALFSPAADSHKLAEDTLSAQVLTHPQPLPASDLAEWYKTRATTAADDVGMVDIALSIIQHGASQGLPGLDEFGEELGLFNRLIYDAPSSEDADEDEWTFSRWLELQPRDIIKAYVAHSTPETIVHDIRTLVLPYLFVLDSRAERSSGPDTNLSTNLFYDYILSTPIDITVSIFEASKPTLPPGERLIRNDEDIARLALACLYGSNNLDSWSTMSRIFECLPAWDVSREDDGNEDVADTTITSLGAFVTPSTSRPECTPADLLMFFKPLPLPALSRSLDLLDVHLESGEILSRWGTPAPLRWFLQSNDNEAEQRSWATRIARRGASSDQHMDTLDDWQWLLEDMLKLCGKSDNGIRGALGLIHRKDVMRIFFAGLLGTGRFELAKSLIKARKSKFTLKPNDIEEICIACSHEFYDNATSGNYKVGDMKLAYECLGVPTQSDKILQEKEFIEATSRLSSFNLTTRGNPITPLEIRLTKDRLSLVSHVLSSNPDAYKHTEVILDLVYKLGFSKDPVAEIKTLAMISDTALLNEDFSRAFEVSERMVANTLRLRSSGKDEQQAEEARQVCWMTCYQLGRQPEFNDPEKKMTLLGRALELCPAEQMHDVLTAWRKLSKDATKHREERRTERKSRKSTSSRKHAETFGEQLYHAHTPIHSLAARLQDFRMPTTPLLNTPDAAALASRTFRSVAANLPFGGLGRPYAGSQGERISRPASAASTPRFEDEVSAQASRVLSKGIGWLIGDDS